MGMAIIYGLKVNLSVAIVAMVNQTALLQYQPELLHEQLVNVSKKDHLTVHDSTDNFTELSCTSTSDLQADGTKKPNEDGPLVWSEPEQGLVLGSYFWGYLLTQIPGGRLAEIYGGKWVFFTAVTLNIFATLMSPVCSSAGFQYLILMRILKGLGGGVTFPAMNVLIAEWAPQQERSTISAIVYGGTSLGTVLSIPSTGLIAGSLGWEWVFYIHGGLALIWCVLWAMFVSDAPDKNKFISEEEKRFISEHHAHSTRPEEHVEEDEEEPNVVIKMKETKPPVPWKSILTSVPFWALCISHALNNFGWYMLLVELPLFMRTGLGFNIKENALLSSVPFLCNWIYSMFYGKTVDVLVHKGVLRTVTARKLSMAIASLIPGGCLIGVCLSGCDSTAIVVLMIIATCFYGSMFAGVFSNHTDIASNYAGILMGFTNMVATIPGFAVPGLVGVLTHGRPGLGPWHTIFYITAGLLLLEFFVFTLFASATEQEWNNPQTRKTVKREKGDDEEKAKLAA